MSCRGPDVAPCSSPVASQRQRPYQWSSTCSESTWLSGRPRWPCSRCFRRLFRRTRARFLPAIARRDILLWLSHDRLLPFLLYVFLLDDCGIFEFLREGSEPPMCGFANTASRVSTPAASPLPHRHRAWMMSMMVTDMTCAEFGEGLHNTSLTLSSQGAVSRGKTKSRQLETLSDAEAAG